MAELISVRKWIVTALVLCLLAAASMEALRRYRFWKEVRRSHDYDALVAEYAGRYQVDPQLVRAVIWRESRFRPDAKGDAGERGLMQIMPAAADDFARVQRIRDFDYEMLYHPATNIMVGTWYLGRSLRRWSDRDNAVPFALAEYNAGRRNVLRWVADRPDITSTQFVESVDFPSTRLYIQSIMSKHEEYLTKSTK